jgi:hypothetical protein
VKNCGGFCARARRGQVGLAQSTVCDFTAFRLAFAMGKIRGTQCMESHISVHRATTKYFSNSFVFKNEIEKNDFQEVARLAWAQEATRAISYGCIANPAVNCVQIALSSTLAPS